MVSLADRTQCWETHPDSVCTYTGNMPDGVVKRYYYRHRMYAAELGRFLTRDPSTHHGAGFNQYGCRFSNALAPIVSLAPAEEVSRSELSQRIDSPTGFPGFPHDDPDIVKSHTSLDIIVKDVLKSGNVCGDVQLRAIKRCKFTIVWKPTIRFGCVIPKRVFNSRVPNGDVCAYLATEAKNKGIHKIPCPDPDKMECCNKKKYWGTHNVTVSANNLKVPYQPCEVTFTLTANVGIVGQLGTCSKNAASEGK